MNRVPHRCLRSAGYTFLEMVSTMLVMSLMLGILIPHIEPVLERSRVNGAANAMAGDLHYAQALAVQYRRPMTVVVVSPTEYVIRERDNPSTVYRRRAVGMESDFTLDEFAATPTSVDLYPNGVTRETITFTLGLHGFQRKVRMTRAGQIRILRVS